MDLSIITIVYNGEKTLNKTIQSIEELKSLTKHKIEYIVIDGQSTDNTDLIIQSNSDIIDFWISEKDKGIYDAYNKGLSFSSNPYVTFLNADDYLIPTIFEEYLDEVHNSTLSNNKLSFVCYNQLSGEKIFKSIKYSRIEKIHLGMTIAFPGAILAKQEIQKAGTFNNSLKICADYELLLKMMKNESPLKVIPKVAVTFATGGVSTNQNYFHLRMRENRIARLQLSLINRFIGNVYDIIVKTPKFYLKKWVF